MKNLHFPKNALMASAAIVALAAFVSCSGDKNTNQPNEVKAYYDKDITERQEATSYSAYFDLSNGIIEAYKTNPAAESLLRQSVNRLTSGEDCTVFSMADDQIETLNLKQTALYNLIVDASSYQRQMAPIEKTLGQIVSEGKPSLMVTDFEEYTPDKRIQHASFAAPYFQKWLQAGRDVTFFVYNYVEGKAQTPKHLYFIVFDNKQHNLLKMIRESMNGMMPNAEFTLSPDAYSFTTEYPSAIKGGNYHAKDGHDYVTEVNESGTENSYTKYGDEVPVEYYPFNGLWEDVVKNAAGYKEIEDDTQYTHLLRGLFFDFSNQDSYIIKKLDIRVTNVERDFQKFTAYNLFKKDQEAFAKRFGSEELTPEFDYSKGPAPIEEVKDMLVLDQKLFDDTFKKTNGKKTEVGIDFSEKFTGHVVSASDADMLRIDVIIAESVPNISPRLDELFSFNGNNNLRDAITVTLQNMNPRGKVIYTYFLRTQE